MKEKPILFSTEMVRAILDGRKTVTRRVVKDPYSIEDEEVSRISGLAIHKGTAVTHGMPYPDAPYSAGDILYVRETWTEDGEGGYLYRADVNPAAEGFIRDKNGNIHVPKWRPSIHMPKEAARIWLRVTGVRIERLRDITDKGARAEGCGDPDVIYCNGALKCEFAELWQRTIKPKDLSKYGYLCNPWVWVIEFERCEKPEECHEAVI